MLSFCKFLEEKVLNIGDRSVAYPKFGNILICAGGSGSGKSFVVNKMFSFEGKRFDTDNIKLSILSSKHSQVAAKFFNETGRTVDSITPLDPDDVSLLHKFVSDNEYNERAILTFFMAQMHSQHKANAIMDVTLKDIDKLKEISELATIGGYDKTKIHIVWILNDFNVAIFQNAQRDRMVGFDIILKTHIGASKTMKELVSNISKYRKYADGDIWLMFNKAMIDNDFIRTGNGKLVLKKYTAIRLKAAGLPCTYESIEKEIIDKINSYVPKNAKW